MPIAPISLVDRDVFSFKSHSGLPEDLAKSQQVSETYQSAAVASFNNQVTVIEDLARDRRFANNPWIKISDLTLGAPSSLR